MSNNEMVQILKAINDLRDEVRENKKDEDRRWEQNEKRWEENDRRWEENERRWEENERRWQENDRRWEENERRWQENEKRWKDSDQKRSEDVRHIENILWSFQTSIEKMFESDRQRLTRIEEVLHL